MCTISRLEHENTEFVFAGFDPRDVALSFISFSLVSLKDQMVTV